MRKRHNPNGPLAITVAAVLLRRRWLVYGLVSVLAVIAVVITVWVVTDRLSSATDFEQRLHQVASTLPPTATRTVVQSGGNFRIESYVVPGDMTTVADAVRRSVHSALDGTGEVTDIPSLGGPPNLAVAFQGRNGCDGTVEIEVNFTTAKGTTEIEVKGHCED